MTSDGSVRSNLILEHDLIWISLWDRVDGRLCQFHCCLCSSSSIVTPVAVAFCTVSSSGHHLFIALTQTACLVKTKPNTSYDELFSNYVTNNVLRYFILVTGDFCSRTMYVKLKLKWTIIGIITSVLQSVIEILQKHYRYFNTNLRKHQAAYELQFSSVAYRVSQKSDNIKLHVANGY